MQNRFVHARINSGTNASTSCKILVNISPLTSEFKRAKIPNCAATRPQFEYRRLFGTLAFQNGLEYHNFDFSKLIGNHFCTTCENLVNFGSVTPEF